jgi:opacity protein-like surface antigen
MTSSRAILKFGVFSFFLLLPASARAAAPWVDRAITLPGRAWAFNFGLGLGHLPNRGLAPALNLEGAVSIAHGVQIGLRTAIRFGDTARFAQADYYGRPFDTETYGTGVETVANPEFHIRARLIESQAVEVGVEGRAYAPFSQGFGILAGIPLAFHFGRVARLDTGVYVPILFYDPTRAFVSFPIHLWFQTTNRLWLGPMTGAIVDTDRGNRTVVPLGFGLGYAVTGSLDFKTQFLFRDVAHGNSSEFWGFGAGLEVRID